MYRVLMMISAVVLLPHLVSCSSDDGSSSADTGPPLQTADGSGEGGEVGGNPPTNDVDETPMDPDTTSDGTGTEEDEDADETGADADDVEEDVDVTDALNEPIDAEVLSCEGRCGDPFDSDRACQCNSRCSEFGNCCDDYDAVCLPALLTCEGRCGATFDSSLPCQCNDACGEFGNCCDDFATACPVPCEPACAGYETCTAGVCEGNTCRQPAQCPGGVCFEGQCSVPDAGCEAKCQAAYGGSTRWVCYAGGWCGLLGCGQGADCRMGTECVRSSAPEERVPASEGVIDSRCVVTADSPCGGRCALNQTCEAATSTCR